MGAVNCFVTCLAKRTGWAPAAPWEWALCRAIFQSRSKPFLKLPERFAMNNRGNEIENAEKVPSPALLIHRERVEENVRRMIAMAGGADRLRPHIKTHKIQELVRLQQELGITKFKCSTIAEAERAARQGADDMLLAYQPVGPGVVRFIDLCLAFTSVRFSCIVDDASAICALSNAAEQASFRVELLLDIDVGQHRTGAAPDSHAFELYRLIAASPAVKAGGLHAYDGHIHDSDVKKCEAACEAAFAPVEVLRRKLERENLPVPRIVAGGTPTFPMHARRGDVE